MQGNSRWSHKVWLWLVPALLGAVGESTAGAEPPNFAQIVVTSVPHPDRSAAAVSSYGLTRNDLATIVEHLPNLRMIVPVRELHRQARFQDQLSEMRLIGTVAEFAQLHQLQVARGRFLSDSDVRNLRNVAVLSEHVARGLFAEEDPIGRNIRVGGDYFLVVGIVQKRSRGENSREKNDRRHDVFIPVSTMRARLGDQEVKRQAGQMTIESFELSRIEIVPRDVSHIWQMSTVVERLLDARHEDTSYQVTTSPVE